ncbi:MAG TPA: pyrroline-5-carboxylate reductase [Myxococcota bacterium]|nr:pyrroline-5-carboxylate reductase [Myxococcota bacterium]
MIGLPKSVGTIGAGNMAEAILRGLLRAGMSADQLSASDTEAARRTLLRDELGIHTTESNAEIAERAEVVVLAVKPQQLERAAHGLPKDGGPLYLSIVAGATTASLRRLLGAGARIVRSMPNTPALVGAGISAVASDGGAEPADVERAAAILRAVGEVVQVPESALDAVTGLSGSGPAYVFLLIEGLTEAGVREGLSTEVARALALETVHGAARLARETGEHPALLRERVTSPGGTTSAGLAALESAGFRAALLAAVRAATLRSRELGKP